MRVIKISDRNYEAINKAAGDIRKELGRPVSMDAALTRLLGKGGNLETAMQVVKITLSKRKEIVACYLFGSVAKGMEGRDVDIGLLLRDGFKPHVYYEGEIMILLEKAGVRNPDVRILNGSNLRFLNQVFRYGKLIFSNDEKARMNFESRSTLEYIDIKRFHKEYDRQRSRRLLNA